MDDHEGRGKVTFRFFIGLHHPAKAQIFERACISINSVRQRKGPLPRGRCEELLLDSGAFTEISRHGRYRHSPAEYAQDLRRVLPLLGTGVTVVCQDLMCEPFIIEKTGLSIAEHQRLTIERYDALASEQIGAPLLPVIQGFAPEDYVRHIRDYGHRLSESCWVGVGSVCKRNARPAEIAHVLSAIHRERPDLQLHGFGVKLTALMDPTVRALLATADSMAWSFAARIEGRNGNDVREAIRFKTKVESAALRPSNEWQPSLPLEFTA